MKFILLLLFPGLLFAAQPVHWNYLLELSEKHEFYKNNEVITKPRESWQMLFGLSYVDSSLRKLKDCVFYKVPGEDTGTLKIKTLGVNEKCDDYILSPGDREWSKIKTFLFNQGSNSLVLELGFENYRNETWEAHFQKKTQRPESLTNVSSAGYKGRRILFLAPTQAIQTPAVSRPEAGSQCHLINDDCEELKPSTCDECAEGWFEIPNGCKSGPKFCGRLDCGGKGKPACRRGMVWQRKEGHFDCRVDSSFAYCAQGLTVQCEGLMAYCR